MIGKKMMNVRMSTKTAVFLILLLSLFIGCSGGGGTGGSGGGEKSSDGDLQKIGDELKKLGSGKWEITKLEREGDALDISFQVGDDPGKVSFKEAKDAEAVVHKIMPKAIGQMSWISVQGVGLRTVLLEASEGGAPGGAGEQPLGQAGEQPQPAEQTQEHQGEHQGTM